MSPTIGDMKTNPFEQPIEIFRAGRQRSDDGRVFDITADMLRATASAYDPALHEAPLVVGHPKTNLPAFGWAKGLLLGDDGVLRMNAKQVEPQFAELVEAGRYKKRSASFYLPDDPSNPKPGVLYLRHVGWLGAEPPAVKGLADVQFSEGDGSAEFSEWASTSTVAQLVRGIRDFFIDQFGLDKANQATPDYLVSQLEQLANEQTDDDSTLDPALFSETPPIVDKDMSKELQAQLDAANAALAAAKEREAKFAEDHRKQVHAGIVSFSEAQVKAGRVLPHQKDGLVVALDIIANAPDAKPISFSEGGAAKELPALDWLMGFISTAKPQVDFSERAGDALPEERTTAAKSDEELHQRATEYAAKHNVNYSEALSKVSSFTSAT
jgi:hypothetical protein